MLTDSSLDWNTGGNSNSQQQPTSPGNVLHGQLTFLGESRQAYSLVQTDTTTGLSSSQTVPVPAEGSSSGSANSGSSTSNGGGGAYQNFSVIYFVFEKEAECNQYPPNNIVTFYDIAIYCNGRRFYPKYTLSFVDDVCNMRAHQEGNNVTITWNSNGERKPRTLNPKNKKSARTPRF